jgi:cytochrome c oxidase subunit II
VSRLTLALSAAVSSFLFLTLPAWAQQQLPQPSFPVPWQMDLQHPVTETARRLVSFHNLLMWVITVISLFVLVLLLIVIFRFNEKANPVPAKWSHNTLLEVVWTAVPVLILVVIAVPSYRVLYFADRTPNPEMTVKVIGNQWYWSYEYPDDNVTFDSLPIADADIDASKGERRLLAVDNQMVVPVGTKVRLLMSSTDVIHSWAVPAFGVKLDSVPGRTNETWTEVDEVGRYFGQCSQLCGVNHSFMPIVVDAVSKEDFKAWLAQKKQADAPAAAPDAAAAPQPDAAPAAAPQPDATPR